MSLGLYRPLPTAYRLNRYSEILDFHNIDQGNEAGQALVAGQEQGDAAQAFA